MALVSDAMIPLARPDLKGDELANVRDCLLSGEISGRSPWVAQFETALSAYLGAPALSCSSGTAALHLALLAAGVGPGDDVIVPDLTFAATAAVVLHVGANPVLVDVGPQAVMTPEAVDAALTPRTRAVIPVHLYGQACDVAAIRKVVWPSVAIIEDCAESLGIVRKIEGDYACYSFFANKVMTTGEGGAVAANPERLERIRLYREHGRSADEVEYYHEVAGFNFRLTGLQAALGCAQLDRLPDLLRRRQAALAVYRSRVRGFGSWLYCAAVPDAVVARIKLKEKGIETRPVFFPLHRMPPYRTPGEFGNANMFWSSYVCLPTGPHVTADLAHRICDALMEITA